MTMRERCCSDTMRDLDASLSTRLDELHALEDAIHKVESEVAGLEGITSLSHPLAARGREFLLLQSPQLERRRSSVAAGAGHATESRA